MIILNYNNKAEEKKLLIYCKKGGRPKDRRIKERVRGDKYKHRFLYFGKNSRKL